MGGGEPELQVLALEPVGGGVWREGGLRSGGRKGLRDRVGAAGRLVQHEDKESRDSRQLGRGSPGSLHGILAISPRWDAFGVLFFSDTKEVQGSGVQRWRGGPHGPQGGGLFLCSRSGLMVQDGCQSSGRLARVPNRKQEEERKALF